MIHTKITELFGVEYPIFQGGMAWVAEADLAAAVSNAGGVGLIAGGPEPAETVRREIRRAKALTDKPFGVNIMLMSPFAPEIAQLVIDEGVAIVTTGAGNPGKYIPMWKAAGIKVAPVVASVALAKRMERAGADALVAEGCEAGGHIGELTTMALVPQVVDAVSIPVLAAGGIADARGVAAALMLGAQGVQVGTRFLAADECRIHQSYKQALVQAKDTDSVVAGRGTGHPVRLLRSRLTRKAAALEQRGVSPDEFEAFIAESFKKAYVDGNLEEGSFMAGQGAGLISKVQPAREIVTELFGAAEQLLKNGGNIIG